MKRRSAELAKAAAKLGVAANGKQSLAMYGPTKEVTLVTEAHALKNTR